MKYLYYIIIIIFLSTLFIGYRLFTDSRNKADIALVINDQQITVDQFNKLHSSRAPYLQEESDFINSLITKQLLIQEAKREGLDQEEAFRWSIQNFYEQSLIKVLMDRRFSALVVEVSDAEIDRYLELSAKKLELTVFTLDDIEEARSGKYGTGKKLAMPFNELAMNVRYIVLSLVADQMTDPIFTDPGYTVYRLDNIEEYQEATPETSREKVKNMLREYKMKKNIDDWVAGLRNNADIKVLINTEEGR